MSFEGVQIELLPPNTESLIQPMAQGSIHALYMQNALHHLVEIYIKIIKHYADFHLSWGVQKRSPCDNQGYTAHLFEVSYKTQIYSVSSFWFHLIHSIGFSQTWVWEFVY